VAKRGRVYNNFFNPEEWELVNPLNKEIMEDYKMELKQNQKSEGTIKQYYSDWRQIMLYIYRYLDNKYILELNKKDFRRFSLWLTEECHVSNARNNRIMSSSRSLLTFCENEDDIDYDNNIAKKVKGLPKKEVRDIIFISDKEIMKLKDELLEREEYQKATLLMLVYDSAARKNELYQVKKECFYDENRRYTNIVIGKRGKKFPLVYFNETYRIAQLYLEQRGKDDIPEMWISGKTDKKVVAEGCIYDWFIWMNDLLEKLENKKIGWNVHSLRHTSLENYETGEHYMCKILNKSDGFTLSELQLLAHHSSSDTTSGYLKPKDNEMLGQMFGIQINESKL
jgi:integrase/recombinase XerD